MIDLHVADSGLSQSPALGTWWGSKGGVSKRHNIAKSCDEKDKRATSRIVRPALPHLAPPPSIRLRRRPSASAPRAPPQSPNPPPPSILLNPIRIILQSSSPYSSDLLIFYFPLPPPPPPPSSIFSSVFPAAQHASLRSPSLLRPGQSFSSLTRSEPRPRSELLKLRKWRRNVIEAAR